MRLTWAGFGAIAAAAFAYMLWEGRGNTFFYDEWGWIETLRSGVHSVLGSYNQHLEVVPLGVYQVLFHTVGISHYWPYQLLAVLGHLACAAAVFAFAIRRIGSLALLVAVPVAFFGAGWEFILWGVNFGFTTSIALSVAALIALDRGDSRTACGLLTLGLLFSETAVMFAAGVAVELTWRDRSVRRMWVWAVPALVYGVWWLAYYQPYLSEHDVAAIPTFGAQLAASAAGGLFGLGTGPGWAVLALLVALLVVSIFRRAALSARLVGLGVTVLLFWGLVAFGRAELGDPGASRYVYTGSILMLLLVLEALRDLRPRQSSVALIAVLAGLSLVGNIRAFGPGEAWLGIGSRTTAAELGALDLARATAPPDLVLDPAWAPQVVARDYFDAVRALSSTPAVSARGLAAEPTTIRVAVDRLLVRAGEVGVTAAPAHPVLAAAATEVAPVPGGRVSRSGACLRLSPGGAPTFFNLALPSAGLELRLVASGAGSAPPSIVSVRRFADVFAGPPVATLAGPGAVVVKPIDDGDRVPWQIPHRRAPSRPGLRLAGSVGVYRYSATTGASRVNTQ